MQDLQHESQSPIIESKNTVEKDQSKELPFEDDLYPGSFFRVPGVPRPGKTAWRSS